MRETRARELIDRFLARGRRYLWTDAFAVCTLLGMGERDRARALVDDVHRALGVSGEPEHPTRRGLRIGKPLPERGRDDPYDERLEWDRDGQYFHYLTRWMHALHQIGEDAWARELAIAGHHGFTYTARSGERRMYWKMSIDLSYPLVASMGHHDPLDGLITALELGELDGVAADYAAMIDPTGLATDDPLGLGGLLVDAYRVEQLIARGATSPIPLGRLHEALVAGAATGLRRVGAHFGGRAEHRLAFRELGLTIGLAAVGLMRPNRALAPYAALRAELETYWLEPARRRSPTWLAHEDINDVMLATSLAPEGFLKLAAPAR